MRPPAALLIAALVFALPGSWLLGAGLLGMDEPLRPIEPPANVTPVAHLTNETIAAPPLNSTPPISNTPFVPVGTPPTYTYVLNPCLNVLRPAYCPTVIPAMGH